MDDIRQKVLDFCNSVRSELGLGPVDRIYKGVPRVADSCVISNTIKDGNPERFQDIDTEPIGPDSKNKYDFKPAVEITFLDERGIPEVDEFGVRRIFDLPPEVNQFALDFDEKKYPDLIERVDPLVEDLYAARSVAP